MNAVQAVLRYTRPPRVSSRFPPGSGWDGCAEPPREQNFAVCFSTIFPRRTFGLTSPPSRAANHSQTRSEQDDGARLGDGRERRRRSWDRGRLNRHQRHECRRLRWGRQRRDWNYLHERRKGAGREFHYWRCGSIKDDLGRIILHFGGAVEWRWQLANAIATAGANDIGAIRENQFAAGNTNLVLRPSDGVAFAI